MHMKYTSMIKVCLDCVYGSNLKAMSGKRRSENFSYDQRMGLVEAIRVHAKVMEDKRSDTSANKKKQIIWEAISKQISANFPERPKSSAKDLRELWRRMKTKAKAVAREKNIDLQKTGGGAPDVGDIGDEILAILTIIAADLEQIRNDVDDDALTETEGMTEMSNDAAIAGPSDVGSHLSKTLQDINNVNVAEPAELEDCDAPEITQNLHRNQSISRSTATNNTSLTSRRSNVNPVLQKTTESLSYMKQEHEAKMALINLQKQAAVSKRKSYEAKAEYYKEKLKQLRIDL